MTFPKIYGLIGYPLKQSFSPAMHNAAFKALNIDAEYKLFPLEESEIGNFFKKLQSQHIFGLNVTAPYKEKVMPFLNKISDEAKLIGAVNTIRVSGDNLEGFNTDGEGFLRHLTKDLGFDPEGKRIAIIGAGGAAKAVSVYLSKSKPQAINIFDVDTGKVAALFDNLRAGFKGVYIKLAVSIIDLNIEDCDLLVNATPVGMKETDPCLVDEKFVHKDLLVYDLVYNPPETKLLKMAKGKGTKTSNGLGMLLYQGAEAFEIWTGKSAPAEVMRRALEEAMHK